MNNMIKGKLINAYKSPDSKFCYYMAENYREFEKIIGVERWDWTPQKIVNVEPWFWNTHTIPLTFGCEAIFKSDGEEWVKAMISDPAQVEDIAVPDARSGRCGMILERMEQMIKELPEDTLIRMPDIQSPLGVAELMWDQSFYIALMTNPDEIHKLLSKITSFIVKYIQEMKNICGERIVSCTFPHVWSGSDGFYLSDDANSMVSPEMHAEYSVNYINRLTEQLGPVYYHTCTYVDRYFENISNIKHKIQVNWSLGTSADPAVLIKELSGKTVIALQIGLDIHKQQGMVNFGKNLKDEYDVVKYLVDNMQDNTTLYLSLQNTLLEKPEIVKKIYNLMLEKKYTPQQVCGGGKIHLFNT